jgi:hypothetical protein
MGAFAAVSDAGLTPVMGDEDRAAARELSLRGVRPPAKVPGYDEERFLGHGAYGEVWTAVNRNSGRRVAIKFFTRRGGMDWAALAREVEKLRYLFNDRYVVQLFEVGWESEPPYYVMEYMENGSLEDLLRAQRPSVPEAVALFREVAVALVHAHDKGILHCDLKPANILLDSDRRPRLADFGQSRLTNELSPALGTLFYMAPEQADLAAAPDARWDVYALGAVMYRMLTGEPPHRNEAASTAVTSGTLEDQLAAYRKLILHSPKPAAHRAAPGVDAGLAAIVDRCIEASPGKRYPNPQAVLAALDAWSLRRARRPLMWMTAATFAVLFALMALFGQYLFRTTVATAERGVVEGAREATRFAAEAKARQFASQVQLRWLQLDAAARSGPIKDMLRKGDAFRTDPALGARFDQLLAARKERSDRQFPPGEKGSVWFADGAGGYQRATAPPYPEHRNQYRGYRDYFTGIGRDLPEGTPPPPPAMIRGPHRSAPFRRKLGAGDQVWTVAYTVPVPGDAPGEEPLGVVGLVTDLSESAPERTDRFAVLVDTRPDAKNGRRGLILRHPYWAKERGDADPPLYYADEVVKWADETTASGDEALPFGPGADYTDPVSQPSGSAPGVPEYGGQWLASAYRVRVGPEQVDTGWVVLVQERRAGVLRPVRQLEWRLGYVAVVAAALLLALGLLMWSGMLAVMDPEPRSPVTRMLRRWAGLPTRGGSLTGGTASSPSAGGSSLAAAPTAHQSAAGTPGNERSEDRGQRSEDRDQRPDGR